jgi:serine-type D-Ala-D-Ala carboxypeptidase/endopeptidase (penicillin-binding protein 4)
MVGFRFRSRADRRGSGVLASSFRRGRSQPAACGAASRVLGCRFPTTIVRTFVGPDAPMSQLARTLRLLGRPFAPVLMLALVACAPARPAAAPASGTLAALGPEIQRTFDDTAFAHAHWGVVVRSLSTGETVYRRNGEKLFIPASNVKLITGATALEALGPDFRHRTEIAAAGAVQGGVLRGDLLVRAGGDPTISARFHADARTPFRAWADSLRSRGVVRIAGAIVAIDDYFDDVPYGRGWTWDDLHRAYSAPIAGLQLDEGSFRLQLFPGRVVGAPALVSLDPPTGHVRVLNHAVTVAAGQAAHLAFGYDEADMLVVTGQVPHDTIALEVSVAVREPVRYFVTVLRETLREAGIQVDGPALVWGDREEQAATPPRYAPLFVHHSAPLREIIPAFMKPSQNQMAEMVLKTLGRELRGEGSAAAAGEVIDSMFAAWQLPPERLLLADGSGLSRYNFTSPDLLLALLERMTHSPNWDVWYPSLTIAGIDGTLRNRMRDTPAEANVHAKTGTLANVRALSGYVTTADGERLIFSMIVNGHALTAADADRLVDATLARLAGFSRRSAPPRGD